MRNMLMATLLCATPLAQAQTTWSHVLATPQAGLSLPAAPAPALAPDAEGQLFVQAAIRQTPRIVATYALNSYGQPLPQLTTQQTAFAGNVLFEPRGISAHLGHRVSTSEGGTVGNTQRYVYQYWAGQTAPQNGLGFQPGTTLSHVFSDGLGAYIAFRSAAWPTRPELRRHGSFGPNWRRFYAGCPGADYLSAELLALDLQQNAGGTRITAATRCTDPSSPGTIAVVEMDPLSGDQLAVRRSWPYADSAAPVVAAFAIGDGRFVLEQSDPVSGEHIARIVDGEQETPPLALPPPFQLQTVVRHAGGAVIIAQDPASARLGALRFAGKSQDWVEFSDVASLAGLDLAWSADPHGSFAVAYRHPQSGMVQVMELDGQGSVSQRRNLGYQAQPGGRIAFTTLPDSDEVVLAADVLLPGQQDGIYLEQFAIDTGIGMIPWPPQ